MTTQNPSPKLQDSDSQLQDTGFAIGPVRWRSPQTTLPGKAVRVFRTNPRNPNPTCCHDSNESIQSLTQGLQVCKWYLLWGLKSINRTYFGLFGAPGLLTKFHDPAKKRLGLRVRRVRWCCLLGKSQDLNPMTPGAYPKPERPKS